MPPRRRWSAGTARTCRPPTTGGLRGSSEEDGEGGLVQATSNMNSGIAVLGTKPQIRPNNSDLVVQGRGGASEGFMVGTGRGGANVSCLRGPGYSIACFPNSSLAILYAS